MVASATRASSAGTSGFNSTDNTPTEPLGPHNDTASAAGAVDVAALTRATFSRKAAAVRLALSRGMRPMRVTSFSSNPWLATGDSELPSFDAIQTMTPLAPNTLAARSNAPESAPVSPREERSAQISPTSRKTVTATPGSIGGGRTGATGATGAGCGTGVGGGRGFLMVCASSSRHALGSFTGSALAGTTSNNAMAIHVNHGGRAQDGLFAAQGRDAPIVRGGERGARGVDLFCRRRQ